MTDYYRDCPYCEASSYEVMYGKGHDEKCPLYIKNKHTDPLRTNHLRSLYPGYD